MAMSNKHTFCAALVYDGGSDPLSSGRVLGDVRAEREDCSELMHLDFNRRNRFFSLIESNWPELACSKGPSRLALVCPSLHLLR